MHFKTVDDKRIIGIVQEWLEQDGEAFMDVFIPRSGGGPTRFLLTSIEDFQENVNDLRVRSEVDLLRVSLYPLHGVIDRQFIETVQTQVIEGNRYELVLVEPDKFGRCTVEEYASMEETKASLQEYIGKRAYFGRAIDTILVNKEVFHRGDFIATVRR